MRKPVLFAAVLVALIPATAVAQRGTHVIQGVTRDSASGLPLAGALVQVRGGADMRSARSDDAGQFRFRALTPGTYRISVLRIGYAESIREVRLVDRDTTLSVALAVTPQALAATRVRGDISAIYGMIGRLPDLLPVAGARIQVLGASRTLDTDSTGSFFIPVDKPGTYFVRITKPGFDEYRFPIEVPERRAVDASRLLDPSPRKPHPATEHLYREIDERLRSRGLNSAFVPGSEIRASGGASLLEALATARSVTIQGLKLSGSACIFVNGIASSMPLEAFTPDEVEAVEVYGARGNVTSTLTDPLGKCRSNAQRRLNIVSGALSNPGAAETIRVVAIWTNKR